MVEDAEKLAGLIGNLGAVGVLSVLCFVLVISLSKRVLALESEHRAKLETIAGESTKVIDANTTALNRNAHVFEGLQKHLGGGDSKHAPAWPGMKPSG